MRRINYCHNPKLLEICQKATTLATLNEKVKAFLPPLFQEHCKVSSFQAGVLTLQVHDAVWASQLRFELPTLRNTLRSQGKLYALVSIQLKINCDQIYLPKPVITPPHLSLKAQNSLKEAAELCSYAPLKKVLLRMSRHRNT